MDRLITLGLTIVFLGFMVVTAGILLSALRGGRADAKAGGVVFLGPIPLVFGSDRTTTVTVAAAALVLMAAYYLIFRR
jgi:uncharacterized protein (TIGR00304 family)